MQGLKKLVRKVAAIGAGGVMLGATLTGALAAGDLADYPAPFVSGGKFVDVALVVGDASTGEDTLALTSVSNKLQAQATGGDGGTITVSGGTTADVPLGKPAASTSGREFETSFEDDDLDVLYDGEISFNSKNYDVSEVFYIDANETGSLTPQTSLTSDDDYETDVRLEAKKYAIGYYYFFDETINLSATTSSIPLDIEFLGKPLKITDVNAAGTQFTANVGDEFYMNVDDSVVVEGKTVTLLNVGSGGSIQVDVDGTTEQISSGGVETVNGIEIRNDDYFYDDDKVERSATLIMGNDATETYKDGDPYVGEDDVDPDWRWDIAELTSSTTTTTNVAATGITPAGITLGILNDFIRDDDSEDPLMVGECYTLPNDYISVCFDSLTVADSDYMSLRFQFENNFDLDDEAHYASGSNQNVVHISVDEAEGLIFDQGDMGGTNGTAADRKTDNIWLYANGTAAAAASIVAFYEDSDGVTQYGGWTYNNTEKQFAHIDYKDVSGTDMALYAFVNDTDLRISLVPVDSNDLTANTDDIISRWALSSRKIKALGTNLDTEEADELMWSNASLYASTTNIGTKDKNLMSKFGIKIDNPKGQGANDQVSLWIPGDIVLANIAVSGTQTTSGTTPTSSGSAPTPVVASELTNPTSFNVITVGGPCVNSVTADFLGLTYPTCGAAGGVPENKAIIEMKANGNKWAMVVAGWNAMDTRRAGVVLANYNSFALTGSSATVTGTDLTVSGITVA